jgi:hypothetical protein
MLAHNLSASVKLNQPTYLTVSNKKILQHVYVCQRISGTNYENSEKLDCLYGKVSCGKGFYYYIVVVSSRLVPGSVVGVTVALDTTQKTLKEWEMIDWLATFLQRQMHCC